MVPGCYIWWLPSPPLEAQSILILAKYLQIIQEENPSTGLYAKHRRHGASEIRQRPL